jgi:hypothetical protein
MVAVPFSLGLVVVRLDRTAAPTSSVAPGPVRRSIPHRVVEQQPRPPDLRRSGSYRVPFASATRKRPLTSGFEPEKGVARTQERLRRDVEDRLSFTSLSAFRWVRNWTSLPTAARTLDPPARDPKYGRFLEQLKMWAGGPPAIEQLDVVAS